MTWNSIMGIISTVALFCPVFFIIALRLYSYSTFPVLMIYYSASLVYNLMTEGYLGVSPELIRYWGLVNNLLDTPMIILFLTHFSTSPVFTKRMRQGIGVIILFELVVVILKGLNRDGITIVLGPGIILIFGLCVYFFIRHAKLAIANQKSTGKALIAAALLFAYGCFGIIYLMFYVMETPFVEDTFLVYFWVVTFSSLLLSAGLVLEQKRMRKLHELRTTRKELLDVYGAEKKAVPVSHTAILDFDRDSWN